MRFLILAVALAFTASPALGQFRPELPQWAEQGNVSVQTPLGLMYDLDWDVPQDDTEGVRWKPILIGAGIGLTFGFWGGWLGDNAENSTLACRVDPSAVNGCAPRGTSYQYRIKGSLIGIGAGAALGWLVSVTWNKAL